MRDDLIGQRHNHFHGIGGGQTDDKGARITRGTQTVDAVLKNNTRTYGTLQALGGNEIAIGSGL